MHDRAVPRDLWIEGKWRESADGRRSPVLNPADEQVFCTVADAAVADGLAAVEAASSALAAWRRTSPRERAEVLRTAYEAVMDRHEEIAGVITQENGKALADARGEVTYAAEFLRWYAEEAVRNVGELSVAPSGQNRILVSYEPIGVSLLVTPWNFPAAMVTRKVAPALAAGCTVVLKPAPSTPLSALLLAEVLDEAGLPGGVLNVIPTARSAEVVQAILRHPAVRKLSFTGSTEVGRLLMRSAAEQVISCSMELGGNAPFIVLDDADLDVAVDAAMVAKMRNGGQACTAANRIFVHETVHDAFALRLADAMGKLVVGSPTDPSSDCGPLADRASRDKVERLLRDAVARGGQVLLGGSRPDGPGFYFAPTVVSGVSREAAIMSEEVFGPVAALTPFSTEDEVVALANDAEVGLAAYVMTRDIGRGLALAERLEVGMVGINRGIVSDAAAPFGGVKGSGLGREGGHHGLQEFCEAKYVAVSW